MKRRLIAMLIALSMIVIATGCGKNYKTGENGEVYNDYVKVKQWTKLEVERVEPVAVKDEEVELAIQSDLQTLTTYEEVSDRGAKEGDQVTIDYVGKMNGVAFQGGTDSDATFILGKGGFVQGFEDGIVGHKVGEKFDVSLTFPKDYYEDMAGKAVVFTMTLDKVENVYTPELTDEVAQKLNPNVKTVAEYKEQVKKDLEASNKATAEDTMRNNLISVFIEQCEGIDYPKDRLEKTMKQVEAYTTSYFEYVMKQYYGTTLDNYLKTTGETLEDLMKNTLGTTLEEEAKKQLASELAFELIAEVEDIEIDDKEYKDFLDEQAELEGLKDGEEFEKKFDESVGEGACKTNYLQGLVADFLWENCVIVEPKATEDKAVTE